MMCPCVRLEYLGVTGRLARAWLGGGGAIARSRWDVRDVKVRTESDRESDDWEHRVWWIRCRDRVYAKAATDFNAIINNLLSLF